MRTSGGALLIAALVGLTVIGVALQRGETTPEVELARVETDRDRAGDAGDAGTAVHGASNVPEERWSDRRRFRVSMRSESGTMPLNRIHPWTIHVADADGRPVDGATILIDGGMPDHHHGLPTEPRVTAQTGPGRYRLDGVKFSMTGWWQFVLQIDDGGAVDSVRFDVTVEE